MPPCPSKNLCLALMISSLGHIAALGLLGTPIPAGLVAGRPTLQIRLPSAQYAITPLKLSRPSQERHAEPSAPPSPAKPPTAPPAPASTPDAGSAVPLSREAELLTQVDERTWPLLPGSPEGRFILKLTIGADGLVEDIETESSPELKEAAERYAVMIRDWVFRPGEIGDRPVRSQLSLEFEIGTPPASDEAAPGGSSPGFH